MKSEDIENIKYQFENYKRFELQKVITVFKQERAKVVKFNMDLQELIETQIFVLEDILDLNADHLNDSLFND